LPTRPPIPETAADFDFESLAPEDAIAFSLNKGYRVGFDWRDLWQV
jgi:hypothetical protein